MRPIQRMSPPRKYAQLLAAKADFSQLSSDPAIRQALWEQQDGFCAYCERSLRNPSTVQEHQSRIEHFHPQNGMIWSTECALCSNAKKDIDAPVAWVNLLLCCNGNENVGYSFTCDKSKDNVDICSTFRNPKQWTGVSLVDIDRDGRALASGAMPSGADCVVNDVLNLNADHLVHARRILLSAFKRRIIEQKRKKNGLSVAELRIVADGIRREASKSEYSSTRFSFADRIR